MTPSNPPHLLLAPPGGGKTTCCLRLIRRALERSPFAPVWVIVRDRLQAQAYRQALAQDGLTLGVEAATFRDLWREALLRAGVDAPVAEDATLGLVTRQVLDGLADAGALAHFARVQATPGFAVALRACIAELKTALVTPERLLSAARARRDPALEEIARIYAAYQQRLHEMGCYDPAGFDAVGWETLRANSDLLDDWSLVLVDGFDSFSPVQRRTLQALAARPPELWITLPGALGLERIAHRRFARAFRALRAVMDLEVVSLPGVADLAPRGDGAVLPAGASPAASFPLWEGGPQGAAPSQYFARLEARLFEPPGVGDGVLPGGQVELLEARSQPEEIREALRWLKARVVRDGFALSSCALILPETGAYRPPLLAAAAEFGLPVRLSHGGRLLDTPPVAALADLLALPLRGCPAGLLLDTLRAPFFDLAGSGLRREDARALELVCRQAQIIEGLEAWREALAGLAEEETPEDAGEEDRTPHPTRETKKTEEETAPDPAPAGSGDAYAEEEEEGAAAPALPRGARAAALLRGLQAFWARIDPGDETRSLAEWARWLAELLEGLHIREGCTTTAEAGWLDALDGQLAALARAGRAAAGPGGADARCTYPAFLSTWLGLLAGVAAADREAAGEDEAAIQVITTHEARGLRFQAAALVGLAEGIFPSVERADPFLNEEVRAELGIEPRLGQDQAGIFDQMVTRADQKLLLTRPYLAQDGEGWEASPFWNAAREALAAPVDLAAPVGRAAAVVRVRPEDHRPLADAASPEELLFWASRRAQWSGESPLAMVNRAAPEYVAGPRAAQWQARCQSLALGQRVLLARVEARPESAYHGSLAEMAAALGERFGRQATWSASRLESYATCPFFFFAGSALALEPVRPPKAGFESFQLGSLLHEVLERVYRECPQPGSVDAVLARLPEVAAQVFAAAPARYAFRPTLLWEVQQAELLETLKAAVLGLAALDAEAGWQPEAFECRFGIGDAPELWIAVDGQPVRLRGVIDRIDRDRDGNLRVIDYKSGSSHLAAQDLIDGRRLQLPLYALAAEEVLGLGRVAEGLYWKLFAQEPGGLRMARFRSDLGQGPRGAYAEATRHVARLVTAIRRGDFSPNPPEGGCPSYCPAASWCWSYRPKAVF